MKRFLELGIHDSTKPLGRKSNSEEMWMVFYNFQSLLISKFAYINLHFAYIKYFIFIQGDQGQRGPPGEAGPKGDRVSPY